MKTIRTILNISVPTILLVVAPSRGFADWLIGPVSKERAKELGMEIRAKTNGPTEVSVELEIKTESGLKNFGSAQRERVELQLRDRGTCLASATLKEDRSKPGRVLVGFDADRAHLDKILLRVWVSQGLGGEIHELRVKDFVELAQRRDDYPDEISQQLFDTYIARRGKINASTYGAAAHIVIERGRDSGFWKTILAELQKGDKNSEVGCVHVLGKMLAVDARARDVMQREKETGEIGQWKPSVCLGPEVVQELVSRGQQTERFRVDQYAIALARARVAEATEFFRMILRDEIGKGEDSAKFHAAVGLAQLGEADGFVWLVAHTDRINGFVASAFPGRMSGAKHLGGCCVAALQQLSGEDLKTKQDWESWWEKVDRKTVPRHHVDLVEPDAFQNSSEQIRPVDERNFMIHGFKVGIRPDSYWPVAANIYVPSARLDDAKTAIPQLQAIIAARLAGLEKDDIEQRDRRARLEDAILADTKGQLANLSVHRVLLSLDIK